MATNRITTPREAGDNWQQMSYGDLVAALRKDLLLDASTDVLPGTVRAAYGPLTVVQREFNLGATQTNVTFGLIDTFTFLVNNPRGAFMGFAGGVSAYTTAVGSKVRLVVDATGAGAITANATPSFFFNQINVHTALAFAGLAGGGSGSPAVLPPGNYTVNVYLQTPFGGSFTVDPNDYVSMVYWEVP